jgi:hypothetical protein
MVSAYDSIDPNLPAGSLMKFSFGKKTTPGQLDFENAVLATTSKAHYACIPLSKQCGSEPMCRRAALRAAACRLHQNRGRFRAVVDS